MIDFDVSHGLKLTIIQGLVVPIGSTVRRGSTFELNVPSLEKTQASFKQLMGIKKKRVVVADDDESEGPVKKDSSDDESSDGSVASETPTEIVESDND